MLIRIGTLSEQTGVSAEVLRSWERRYGLLHPQRTAGGFRLYDDADVARVEGMLALLANGVSAGEAARQVLESSAAALPAMDGSHGTPVDGATSVLHAALRSFNERAIEEAVDRVVSTLDLDSAIRDVFIPALRGIGADWAAGTVSVAQEHFAVNVLRARLMGLARGWDTGPGPRALLACPPGELHDVSLVMFGLALRRRGWLITFLGANTPLEDVASTQRKVRAQLTVLYSAGWDAIPERSPALRDHASTFVLGGSTAPATARATGCRSLEGDPVTAAEQVTREWRASGRRRRRSRDG